MLFRNGTDQGEGEVPDDKSVQIRLSAKLQIHFPGRTIADV